MTLEILDYTVWTGAGFWEMTLVCTVVLLVGGFLGFQVLVGNSGPLTDESDDVRVPLGIFAFCAGVAGPAWTEIGTHTWFGGLLAFVGEVAVGLGVAPILTSLAAVPLFLLVRRVPAYLRDRGRRVRAEKQAYERGDDLVDSLAPFDRAGEAVAELHTKWGKHIRATEKKLSQFRRKKNRESQVEILETELASALSSQEKLARLAIAIWQQRQVANAYVLAETLHRQLPETPHDNVLTPELDADQTHRAITTLRQHVKTLKEFAAHIDTHLETLARLEGPDVGTPPDEAKRQVEELRAPVVDKMQSLAADLRARAEAYGGVIDSLEVVKLQLARPAMDRVPLPPELATVLPNSYLTFEGTLELPSGVRQAQETLNSLISMPVTDLSDDLLDEYLLRCEVDLEAVSEVYEIGQ